MTKRIVILAAVLAYAALAGTAKADPKSTRDCLSKHYQEKKQAFAECTKKFEADKNNESRKACLRKAEAETKEKNKKCK
jgi:hypothetical protein